MALSSLAYPPTLRQLLNSEAMAEAQILFGEDRLDRVVAQVIATPTPSPRPGSLIVARSEILTGKEISGLKDLSALVLVRPVASELSAAAFAHAIRIQEMPTANAVGQTTELKANHPAAINIDLPLQNLWKQCVEAGTPLIMVPSFGEPTQVAEEIRMAFLRELKLSSTRIHSHFVTIVLEEGLEGLVEELSNLINRPVSIETADFKVLASRNMGAIPQSQHRMLTEEATNIVSRQLKSGDKTTFVCNPTKVGRRLVLPIFLEQSAVGFISVMVKVSDDLESIAEYLHPATLAAMIDFSQRRKDGLVFAVTQKSLLKDLLAGRVLSAADQERIERHYGFDLCDGLFVFAVAANIVQKPPAQNTRGFAFTDDSYICTEVEGTSVVVVPSQNGSNRTWQQEAHDLVKKIKALKTEGTEVRVQVGAARLAPTVLDLPDAYKEARQALIIGSMLNPDKEFVLGYGELGVKRLLYSIIDHPELDRFYEENLAPLETYDEEWESELVPSLRVYLQQGANLNSAARALFIHRHTLRYRLEQIAEILKVDIDSQEVLLNLQIAFLIRDMKGGKPGMNQS
jgi:purine catabolism regulator